MHSQRPTESGFTLLEMMVAMLIFALIGIGAHSMLQASLRAREATSTQVQALAQLQKAMAVIAQDLTQIEPASLRVGDGLLLQAVRHGWQNPLALPRSNRRQITYVFENATLRRRTTAVDTANADSVTQTLLSGVSAVRITPSAQAVEIVIDTASFGTVRRLIEVPPA